jgi:SSS family solute:Na+ symporter
MNTLDLLIVAASLLIVVAVGLIASRRRDSDSAEGYFLASGKLPWFIIGSAFVSTSVSSEQIVGTTGAAYEHGLAIANWEWWTLPTYALLILFFIPVYLNNRVTTVSDFLARRYGPLCRDIYSWVMLIAYVIVFLVPVLYGGSLAIASLMDWNLYVVLWAMVALVAAYTVKGGLVSVMWTDAVQCLMLVGGGLALFFYALTQVPGGWGAMMHAAPQRFHLYRPPNDPNAPFPGLILATFGVFLFYQAGNQVMVQRVLGARSTWDGMMGIVFAGFINLLRPLVTCFLGLVVWHWINVLHRAEPLANLDLTFPFVLKTLSPQWGLRGIVLAGFFAAVMSTLSALANSTATLFSLEVYQKLMERSAPRRSTNTSAAGGTLDDEVPRTVSESRLVFVGRLASLLSLVIAAIIAPVVQHFGGIFSYFQRGVTYLATPFISVMLLGIFWPRASYGGAVAGIVGGLAIQITLAIWMPQLWPNVHFYYIAATAQAVTIALIVVVSLVTEPPPPEQWQPFRWSPRLLARLSSGNPRPWHQNLWLWAAIYAAIWIGIYAYFW